MTRTFLMTRTLLPPRAFLTPGMRVGLLGGSFNPAHDGHLHISRMALKNLALDRLIWLVSPQNPLKSSAETAPLEKRLAEARALAHSLTQGPEGDRRIWVTDMERALGTRFSVDTVRALKARYPAVRFIWLMGSDNLIQLPKWSRWRDLVATIPLAIYDRPGTSLKARILARESTAFGLHLDPADATILPLVQPPAITFLAGPEHPASSTALRAGRS